MSVLFLLLSELCVSAGVITGIVYNDNNRSSAKEPGEKLLPGVVVSDVYRFAVTDGSGTFTMDEVVGQSIVYLFIPDGCWYQDSFYRRVYIPEDGAVSVDWALVPQEQRTPFCFAQFTDLHLSEENTRYARMFVERINCLNPQPAFAMGTGDIIIDALRVSEPKVVEERYQRFLDISSKFRVPPLYQAITNTLDGANQACQKTTRFTVLELIGSIWVLLGIRSTMPVIIFYPYQPMSIIPNPIGVTAIGSRTKLLTG